MKKLTLTLAIILGMTLGAMAQLSGGGLFQRGYVSDEQYYGAGYFNDRTGGGLLPVLPNHGETNNQNAPLGSGITLLLGLGGAYLVAKKRREE